MGHVETCVIWGDDPETRQCLGAGVPGTSGRSFQGTAAEAAVPNSSSRGRSGPPRSAILALAAALAACGGFAASAGEFGGDGPAMSAGTPQVDAATGIAGVVFPIEVPPGRHHLQPDLALRYSSTAGPGNAGNGFTLEAGSIERTTRFGPPRFDNTDTFVLTLNGESHELVAVDADSTHFRTAIDTGFLIARLSPGPFGAASTYWVARGRDGRAYRFGFNGDAAAGNVSQVLNFKWGLDRVEDASGNVMEIRHQSQGLRLYPVRIEYASHPATGLPATNVVLICWERRGDEYPTPYGERFLYKLSSIVTGASGAVARTYSFTYNFPGNPTDMLGTCSVLPDYGPIGGGGPTGPGDPGGKGGRGPKIESAALASSSTSLQPGRSDLLSIRRGDGAGGSLPPIEYTYHGGGGSGHWPSPLAEGTPPLPFLYSSSGDEDSGVRVVDLNRDGLPDFIQFAAHMLSATSYAVTRAVYLNTGTSFVYDAAWTAGLASLIDTADQSRSAYFVLKRGTLRRVEMGVRFLDVNDDGFPDIVRVAQHYNLGLRKGVWLNTGSGFTGNLSAAYPLPDDPFIFVHNESSGDIVEDLGVRFADVNADGRADILVSRADWGAPAYRRVYLYDRGAYRLDPGWILPDDPFVRHVSHGRYLDMGMRLMELNGDGLVDLFRASNVNGMVQNVAYLNTGRPGGASPTWADGGFSWWLDPVFGERFVDVITAGDGVSIDRGLRVVNEAGYRRSRILVARSWDGTVEKFEYIPIPTGGWGKALLPAMPGVFIVKAPGKGPRDQGVRMIDLNGDGPVDYVASPESGTREWRPAGPWGSPGLLQSCSNGIGGRVTLVYAPAPRGGTAEGGLRPALPYPLTVVSSQTVEDGMGRSHTTRYAYDGPFHHHDARDFRGFRRVTVIEPGGEQSIEILFHQQPERRAAPLRGVPQERTARRTADGAVFSRTIWTHDTTDGTLPLAHPLLRDETALYDWTTGDAQSAAPIRRTAVSYSYIFDETSHPPDRMMLRRVERHEGSVDDPADDRIAVEDFVSALDDAATGGPALGRWFLDLPVHRRLAGADGLVVSESWTSYDGLDRGAVGPTGLATHEQRRGGPPGLPGREPDDSIDPSSTRGYDAYGNLAWEIDALGRRRAIFRGTADPTFTFPDGETDALGRVTATCFDPRTGQISHAVDPNGAITRTEYDGFGRRAAEYGPYDSADRPTVSYVHDYSGVPARVFRFAREQSGAGDRTGTAGNLVTIAFFDGMGRLLQTKVEAPDGRMVVGRAVTFDAAGRVAIEAEPFFHAGEAYADPESAPFKGRMQYDAAGRLVSAANAAGEERLRQYSGWSTTRIDPAGHRRDLHTDAFGALIRVEDFEGTPGSWRAASIASYLHDAAGRLARITDPAGSVISVTYDTLGRRTAFDDPHAGSWRYAYDPGGNLVAETDPLGRVTRMTYDALDRLVRKDLPDGSVHFWGYDEGGAAALALGRLTSISDPTGVQRFEHDRMGRIVRTSRSLDGTTYAIETAYDAQGRPVREALPGGPAAEYTYDAAGNLSAALPFARALAYNQRGQVTAILLDNGARIENEYDEATGRPTRLFAVAPDGSSLLDDRHSYFADGQISGIDDLREPARPAAQTFAYDGRHRLTRATGPYGDRSYLYDDAGSLIYKEGIGFFHDDPLHPLWITRTSAGQSLSYDPAGNTTAMRSATSDRRMAYDASGRLTTLTDDVTGLLVTNDYDAGGRRIRETTEAPGRPRSVLLTPMPRIEVKDGVTALHYFAGGRRVAIREVDGRVLYPITDHLGSTRAVIDGQGAVVARYDYRPYGQTSVAQDDGAIVHRYAGAADNPESGLLLMGSRHYDPALGRFVQPDPAIANPADPLALNRYAYARDNPVNLTDPNGRTPLGLILFAGAIALLDRDTRADVGTSVGLTAATVFLTGAAGPGLAAGWAALRASEAALYAAAATAVIMNTPLGQGIVEMNTLLLQDLGLAPRTAAIGASIFSTFLLNSHLQRSIAGALAPEGEIHSGQPVRDQSAVHDLAAAHGSPQGVGTPSGDQYGVPIQGRVKDGALIDLEQMHELVDAGGRVVGVYGTRELPGPFEHGAAGFFGPGRPTVNPHRLYLLGGVSTQQFARELYSMGYSGTLFTLTGRASDFLVEFIYGPYGGGLALGVHAGRESAGLQSDPGP